VLDLRYHGLPKKKLSTQLLQRHTCSQGLDVVTTPASLHYRYTSQFR